MSQLEYFLIGTVLIICFALIFVIPIVWLVWKRKMKKLEKKALDSIDLDELYKNQYLVRGKENANKEKIKEFIKERTGFNTRIRHRETENKDGKPGIEERDISDDNKAETSGGTGIQIPDNHSNRHDFRDSERKIRLHK